MRFLCGRPEGVEEGWGETEGDGVGEEVRRLRLERSGRLDLPDLWVLAGLGVAVDVGVAGVDGVAGVVGAGEVEG